MLESKTCRRKEDERRVRGYRVSRTPQLFFSFSFTHVSFTLNAVEIEGLLEVACICRSIFGRYFFVIVVCFVVISVFF